VFRRQGWQRFRIRDGERGPMIWEIRRAPFYRKHGNGLPGRVHTLIVARNTLNPGEVKYFVANQAPSRQGVTLERLLYVGFSRWPIERVFQHAKDELGMDHFEVRGWRAIHRHLYTTQLSHLFCARERQRLREKNGGESRPDGGAGAPGGVGLGAGTEFDPQGAERVIRCDVHEDYVLPAPESSSVQVARQGHPAANPWAGHPPHRIAPLRSA
jgi:hypothetical protein